VLRAFALTIAVLAVRAKYYVREGENFFAKRWLTGAFWRVWLA